MKAKTNIMSTHVSKRFVKVRKALLLGIVGVLIAVQLAVDVFFVRQYFYQSDSTVLTLIERAVRELYKSAPVEPQTGVVYLPEAKLRLPAPGDTSTRFLYSYSAYDNNPELTITTSALLNATTAHMWAAFAGNKTQSAKIETAFKAVPALQSCARGVQIYVAPQTESGKPLFTKRVQDGRTLYAYSEAACTQNMTILKESAAAVESY